jgi:hypothetical protein
VTAAATNEPEPEPEAELSSVQALRANLLADELPAFDAELRAALGEAIDTLDFTSVLECLRRWRRIAAATAADPAAHRRMLAYAADHADGRPVAGEPWEGVKARLGL